jgi:hypothetical protein
MNSLNKWSLRLVLIGSFAAASYALYMAVGMLMLTPGAGSSLWDRLGPILQALVAVILDIDIAYILCGTQPRHFIVAFLVSLPATAVGALLVSFIIWRGQWWAIFVK